MPLTDDQVRRYSRQILLRTVGGQGQETLLATGARASGTGSGLATALAYLAAAGSPTWLTSGAVDPSQPGFLFSHADVGAPAAPVLARALEAMNPDAARTTSKAGQLAELPARFEEPGPWVALGEFEGQGVCVFRSAAGCADCFRHWMGRLSPPPRGPLAMVLGTVAALAFQRGVLGMETAPLRGWAVSAEGELRDFGGEPCPRHR